MTAWFAYNMNQRAWDDYDERQRRMGRGNEPIHITNLEPVGGVSGWTQLEPVVVLEGEPFTKELLDEIVSAIRYGNGILFVPKELESNSPSLSNHLKHYQQCNCLGDSAECCREECDCHDGT